jgi:tetratricopeptide (TPR) repeat protein/class 3 adenylate cyclase
VSDTISTEKAKGADTHRGKAPFELEGWAALNFKKIGRQGKENGNGNGAAELVVLEGEQALTLEDIEPPVEYRQPLFGESEGTFEALDTNSDYLDYLYSLGQDFISPELYEQGKIELAGTTAVLSLDVKGYSDWMHAEVQKSDEAYGGSNAAERITRRLAPINQAVRDVTKFLGGYRNQWEGDGIKIFFEGDNARDNVQRAQRAAELLQGNIAQSGLTVRVGIDVGRVDLVAYGKKEKRADVVGMAVDGAERCQKLAKAEDGFVALSDNARAALDNVPFHTNGSYSSDDEHIFNPLDWKLPDIQEDLEAVRNRIAVREAFLSESMVRDLRNDFVRGEKINEGRYPVSTMVITITGGADSYERRNEVFSEIFEAVKPFRGKVDKVNGSVVMVNYIAWLNELNSVRAAKEHIQNYLKSEGVTFKMAIGRADSLVVPIDGLATVAGEGVIRAYRMMNADDCPENEVVVDKPTVDRVLRAGVKVSQLESRVLKGSGDKLIERYVIDDIGTELAVSHGREVVGRGQELATMQRDLLEARGSFRARFIRATKGNGRSALVGEFISRAQEQGAVALAARADSYYKNQPFSAWRNLLEHSLGVERDSKTARQAVVESFYRENLPWLMDRISALNPILDIDLPASEATGYLSSDEALDADDMRADILAQTLEHFRSKGTDMPMVLVMEDVQFMDKDSERLATKVARKFRDGKLYMIFTSWKNSKDGKSEEADLPSEEFMHELGVTEQSITELAGLPVFGGDYEQAKLGDELDKWWEANKTVWVDALQAFIDIDRKDFLDNDLGYRRIVVLLSQKTGGNYTQLESALAHLTKYRGNPNQYFRLQKQTGKYALSRSYIEKSEFDVIPDIDKLEQDKMERIRDAEAQSLFRDGAVAVVFDKAMLALMSGLPEERVSRHIKIGLEEGLIQQIDATRYEFVDPAVANAAYNSMTLENRKIKHRMIGEYLEQVTPDDIPTLVRHFRNSDDYLKALKYLDAYSRQLSDGRAWGPALTQMGYATKIFGEIRKKDWMIPNISGIGSEMRKLSESEIHDCVHDQIERWFIQARDTRVSSSNWKKVEEILNQVKVLFDESHVGEELTAVEDALTVAKIHREFGRVYKTGAQYEIAEKELAMAEGVISRGLEGFEGDDPENRKRLELELAMIRSGRGKLMMSQGHFDEALSEHEIAVGMSGLDDDLKAIILLDQAECYENLGQADRAKQIFQNVIEYCRANGNQSTLVSGLNGLSGLAMRLGDFDLAEKLYEESITISRKISKRGSAIRATSQVAFGRRIREDFEGARELFAEVRSFYEDRGKVESSCLTLAEEVFCSIKTQDFEQSQMGIAELRVTSYLIGRARSYTLEAMMLAEQYHQIDDGVQEVFAEGIKLLRESKSDTDLAFDLYAMGEYEIKYGSSRRAKEYLLEAKEIYERTQETVELDKIGQLLVKADLLNEDWKTNLG